MQGIVRNSAAFLLGVSMALAQSNNGLAGQWKLSPDRSSVQGLPTPPDPFLRVEQHSNALTVVAGEPDGGRTSVVTYPLDGSESRRQVGNTIMNTSTKWEGSALLVTTLVSGAQNYTIAERWARSRDGNTLTIKRVISRNGNESESILVYRRPGFALAESAPAPAVATERETERRTLIVPDTPAPRPVSPAPVPAEFVVEQGTRLLLRLTNAVDTRRTAVGDRIYLETAAPIFVGGRLIIPRGSYVTGVVTESKQAGRVKGKSALNLRFDSLTLPNGVARSFTSRPGSVDTKGNLDRSEGRIEGDGNKAGDARTVGQTTAAGAGIGTIAGAAGGHVGMGAGIGAAAGAAAGLAGIFGSRGPQVVLPPGTTMELVLDRELRYSATELNGRTQ